jgi:hypothetical protein
MLKVTIGTTNTSRRRRRAHETRPPDQLQRTTAAREFYENVVSWMSIDNRGHVVSPRVHAA